MPLVTIKMFEHRLQQDPELAERLAVAIDEVVAAHCTGPEGARPDTWVVVEGVPRTQWTFNGSTR
ncbi:hypothetical protein MUN76_11280 [Leucobacter rhizosphaerae]|uniref:4-oxalocrotonate tautomerase domain-containing protein n=1 Tax=Leucobacter rhizosphaerae TaxID=2932245 RepID=A0ABY4FTK6_9MICO|nr:hypothetical protein [Leucobacter rhizosphaerae]UOQ59628.1 hypothetical protein MUN76_11280 [Leucobacter rhizosphaerae]